MSSAATVSQFWRELRELEEEISALCTTLSPRHSAILKRLRGHVQQLRLARVDVPDPSQTPDGGSDPLPAGTLLARVIPIVDAHLIRPDHLGK